MDRNEMMKAIQDIDEKFIINADKEFIVMNKNTPKKWVAVASIIAVPIITATAYQAGFLADVVSIFSTNHGNAPEQVEYINEVARPNGASVTVNGTTARVEAIMGDNNLADVVYNISNDGVFLQLPEDTIDPETGYSIVYNWDYSIDLHHVESSLLLGWYMQGGSLNAAFEENDDGTLKLTHHIGYGINPKGETVRVTFHGIGYNVFVYDGDELVSEEYVQIIDDEISLEYVLDYGESEQTTKISSSEVSSQSNGTFMHHDSEVIFSTLSVSPQSVRVEFECTKFEDDYEFDMIQQQTAPTDGEGGEEIEVTDEDIRLIREETDAKMEFLQSIPFYFTKTDGSTIDLYDYWDVGCGMSWSTSRGGDFYTPNEDMMMCHVDIVFDEIFLLDDIVSVTFGEFVTTLAIG